MDNTEPTDNRIAKPGLRSVLPPTKGPAEHQDHADNSWTLRNKLIGFSILFSFLSIVVTTVSVLIALSAVKRSAENQRNIVENQRDMKGIDLLVSFQQRYDALAYDARSQASLNITDAEKSTKAMEWYRRFWDLQFEQYQYWKKGYINYDIYESWMDFRWHEWDTNDSLNGVTYRVGWKDTKEKHFGGRPSGVSYYKDFICFMENVFDGKSDVYRNGPLSNNQNLKCK
jgi:hypothetical protein